MKVKKIRIVLTYWWKLNQWTIGYVPIYDKLPLAEVVIPSDQALQIIEAYNLTTEDSENGSNRFYHFQTA